MIKADIIRGTDEIRRNIIKQERHRIMSRDMVQYMWKLNAFYDIINSPEMAISQAWADSADVVI